MSRVQEEAELSGSVATPYAAKRYLVMIQSRIKKMKESTKSIPRKLQFNSLKERRENAFCGTMRWRNQSSKFIECGPATLGPRTITSRYLPGHDPLAGPSIKLFTTRSVGSESRKCVGTAGSNMTARLPVRVSGHPLFCDGSFCVKVSAPPLSARSQHGSC